MKSVSKYLKTMEDFKKYYFLQYQKNLKKIKTTFNVKKRVLNLVVSGCVQYKNLYKNKFN